MEALFPYLLPYLILTQWFIRLTPNNQNSVSRFKLYFKTYGISALGGFPTGAATISYLKKSNQITAKEANGLLSICHSPSPLFVIGFVGYDLLNDTLFSWRFLILYHIVSFIFLILFYQYNSKDSSINLKEITVDEGNMKHQNPFTNSIKDSVPTVLVVGSTLIFFTTIYTVVMHSISNFFPEVHNSVILLAAASLEMTNGLQIAQQLFSHESFLPVLLAMFLTTQSLSIHMQVAVLAKSENISLKPYVLLRVILTFLIPVLYWIIFL
nr:hypothetical protein [Lysinibacillus timonensis]